MPSVNIRLEAPTIRTATSVIAKGFAVYPGTEHLEVDAAGSVMDLANGLTVGQSVTAGENLKLLAGNDWGKWTVGEPISAVAERPTISPADGGDPFILALIVDPSIAGTFGDGFLPLTGGDVQDPAASTQLVVQSGAVQVDDPFIVKNFVDDNLFTVLDSGAVGIGEAAPMGSTRLTISRDGNPTVDLRHTASTSGGIFELIDFYAQVSGGTEKLTARLQMDSPTADATQRGGRWTFYSMDKGDGGGVGALKERLVLDEDGAQFEKTLAITETVGTPTSIPGKMVIQAMANGILRGVNGAATPHTFHADARNGIGFHGASESTVTVVNALELVEVDVFDTESVGDAFGRVTIAPSGQELELNIAGAFLFDWSASLHTTGGASQQFLITPLVELATPVVITAATNASPIVVTTAVALPLVQNGDIATIEGEDVLTEVNGSWYLVKLTDDTFELYFMDGVASDGTGGGAYNGNASGTRFGNAESVSISTVSNTDIGHFSGEAAFGLIEPGDAVGLWVLNYTATTDAAFRQAKLQALLINA